jgi:hypothetical protein
MKHANRDYIVLAGFSSTCIGMLSLHIINVKHLNKFETKSNKVVSKNIEPVDNMTIMMGGKKRRKGGELSSGWALMLYPALQPSKEVIRSLNTKWPTIFGYAS